MRTKFANLLKPALLIGAVMCCFSCCPNSEQEPKQIDNTKNINVSSFNDPRFKIVTIDNCEYVLYECKHNNGYGGVWTSGLTHKANCKFCKERSLK